MKRRAPRLALLAGGLLALAACVPEGVVREGADGGAIALDAGTIDAGTIDAGEPDASEPDAGPIDAGEPDASALDASEPDASEPDGGQGGCSVGGVEGTCLEVDDCPADHTRTPGLCPGPASVQCCTPRGATSTCDPAVRPTPNAGLAEAPGSGGCPAGMLRVEASPAFCIDRHEAALAEVAADGALSPWSPFHHPGRRRVRALSLAGAVPQGYVDQRVASAACAEAGKRLCTDAEWLRACRGPAGTTYPYGATRQPGACNDARARHPAVELFPDDPTPFDRIQDPCINQLPASLDRTGANAGCASAEGALDLMGNLHEWTADPAGTFRGGFYVDTVINGEGCLYRTTAHDVSHWDYSTGFRCCADAS